MGIGISCGDRFHRGQRHQYRKTESRRWLADLFSLPLLANSTVEGERLSGSMTRFKRTSRDLLP